MLEHFRKPINLSWIPAIGWMILIWVSSSTVVTIPQLASSVSTLAGGRITPSGFTIFWMIIWWIIVKGWHLAQFGILYALLVRAKPTPAWFAFAVAGLYAVVDEAHQTFVSNRGGRISDMCIDGLGILAAFTILKWKVNPVRSQSNPNHVRLQRVLQIFLLVLVTYWISNNPSPMLPIP